MKSVVQVKIVLIGLLLATSLYAHRQHDKIAAGILPYAYDQNGVVSFLIGQEQNGEWSDFGGSAEPGDLSSKMTAIREFSEETRCVFGRYAKPYVSARRYIKTSTCMKLSNRYIATRIGKLLMHPRGYYALYLANVSYISASVFNGAPKIAHYEKRQYEWVPAHKFIAQVRKSPDRRATWFEHKKIRAPFVDMIKAHAHEILKTIGN